jgi:hypothetical protein
MRQGRLALSPLMVSRRSSRSSELCDIQVLATGVVCQNQEPSVRAVILQSPALRGAVRCNRTGVWHSVASSDSPKRQDHDDTAIDPGIARQPDTAVTRRIYFKDYLAPGCREPFSLRQGRLDDLTTTRLGDGAHPNPKSPA